VITYGTGCTTKVTTIWMLGGFS